MKVDNQIKIEFNASEKQSRAWEYLFDNETTFVGYGGSGNSGKSWLEAYWLTLMSISFPGTGWFLARETLTVLKDTTLKTLFKVFKECNIKEEIHYRYREQASIIEFKNGSEIFLLDLAFSPSDELYQWLGGYEFTGGVVDESGEVNKAAINALASRIGRRKNSEYGIMGKILEGFNPSMTHIFIRYYLPWKKKEVRAEYKFVKALPADNPSPDVAGWARSIRATGDMQLIERLLEGNFEYEADPTCLIDKEALADIFTNTHVEKGRKCITSDIARLGGDRIVIIEWEGMRGKVTAFNKQKLTVSTAAIEAARIRNSCGKSDVLVDADGMGSGVEDFGGFKGFVNGSSPMIDPKKPLGPDGKPVKENFDNLKSQCAFRIAEIINDKKLYLECEDWMTDLIMQELAQLKKKNADSDGKNAIIPKDKMKEKLGRSPDFLDAILMRSWFELRPKFTLTAVAV